MKINSKKLDELYKEWSGNHHATNSNKPTHDSVECTDFAEYCLKYAVSEGEMISTSDSNKYECPIKINTMVKFDYEDMPEEYHKHYLDKFPKNEVFVFMGELQQMSAHCIVMNYKTGQIYSGYHTEDFVPLTDDEV